MMVIAIITIIIAVSFDVNRIFKTEIVNPFAF